jgi:ABC-type sugar transport system substrate-binding protein
MSSSASRLPELAIERGAPIFNDGNPAGCAVIDEVAITAIVDLAPDAIGLDALDRLRLALAEGQSESDTAKRAWVYRRAIDRAYETINRRTLD